MKRLTRTIVIMLVVFVLILVLGIKFIRPKSETYFYIIKIVSVAENHIPQGDTLILKTTSLSAHKYVDGDTLSLDVSAMMPVHSIRNEPNKPPLELISIQGPINYSFIVKGVIINIKE